jgi:hypothetical protein
MHDGGQREKISCVLRPKARNPAPIKRLPKPSKLNDFNSPKEIIHGKRNLGIC